MHCRALVVQRSVDELLGRPRATAEPVGGFEHRHLDAVLGQPDSRCQPVGA